MLIDLEKIRRGAITSDEWVELTNIIAQEDEIRERMPMLAKWVDKVHAILEEQYE